MDYLIPYKNLVDLNLFTISKNSQQVSITKKVAKITAE